MSGTNRLLQAIARTVGVIGACGVLEGAESVQIHVSPRGNDAWDGQAAAHRAGTQSGPLATLTAARDRIRALRRAGNPAGSSVDVRVDAGTYRLTETLALGARDSGSAESPVTWRGTGTVLVLGGPSLRTWMPVTEPSVLTRLPRRARKHVVQSDLRKHGVTDFGRISPGGFAISTPPTHLELAWNGETMRAACSPNAGWFRTGPVAKTERVVSGRPRGWKTDRFGYGELNLTGWDANDLWVHGYWHEEWADQYLQVARIDTAKKEIVIAPPQSRMGYSAGRRYRIFNALEALDEPGEYFVDRRTGMLYFWPPSSLREAEASVSVLQDPLIRLKDVSHVRLIGLTLASGRGDGVRIEGGTQVTLENCSVRNMGNTGVLVTGGRKHVIRNCRVHHLGGAGVTVSGGDRQTLTPCKHVVENCDIHHVGSWFRTYRPGVSMRGVGIVCRHNDIHDVPHSGIIYKGNELRIEFNDIYRTSNDANDVGAIYTGRDWTARGNVIQHNYIHDLGGADGPHGSSGIYLDDLASGQIIRGNIFYNVKAGIAHCGGRDNLFENNLMVDCDTGIHVATRAWARNLIQNARGGWDMLGGLKKLPYTTGVWARKYPRLVNILNESPLDPRNNRVRGNLFAKCETAITIDSGHEDRPGWHRFEQNLFDETCNEAFRIRTVSRKGGARHVEVKPHHVAGNKTGVELGFVNAGEGDFALRDDSPALKIGFKPIPLERIGRQP